MFHTLLDQITFEQVVDFCKTFPEGVRVEYKQEPTKHIPKIISSFANTVGGIWIIGVETDKTTNLPKLPLDGMKQTAGVQEQITQSAQTGIYPAITPDVRVLDVPGKPGRMIVVVKVPESIEAPHAIENSTRVYIRTASTTEPYDLADIDRIDYLLKRRRQPEQRREELIEEMASRSSYQLTVPAVRVVVAPIYPRGLLMPREMLFEGATLLEGQHGNHYLTAFRLIHDGILSTGSTRGRREYYLEANTHGIVFFEAPGEINGTVPDYATKEQINYVNLGQLLVPVAKVLNTALFLLKERVTNVLIRYELLRWNTIGFLAEKTGDLHNPGQVARSRFLHHQYAAGATTAVLETLSREHVLTELMRQMLWAFDYTNPQLGMRVYAALKERNLI